MMTLAIDQRPCRSASQIVPSSGLSRLLDEFESLLLTLPPPVCEARTEGGATIAWHVGSCLDLIDALLNPAAARVVVYRSTRGIAAMDRAMGIRRIRAQRASAINWPARPLDGVIEVVQMICPSDDVERGWSTLSNELAFVVNHVVDRQKLIERALHTYGLPVPEGFGSMELQPLRARSSVPPSWSLWRLLDELESLLMAVPADTYCSRFAADVSGSVGEHVRHCLDHVSALVTADPSVTLSYDRRHRGTAAETDPAEALRQIQQLKVAIDLWSTRSLDEPIRVTSTMSSSGDAVTGWSTLARELAFVVSHTIHHQAIIGVLLAIDGHAVPDRFGHSPSTPRRH
jgi:uncharacterized damage-inducible protein DinB